MLGMRVRDATAGFRVYRASILRRLDLGAVEALGYGFQVNMTKLVADIGGRIVEMPITFLEREAGESKLSGGIFGEELSLVTKWGLQAPVFSSRFRRCSIFWDATNPCPTAI